MYVTGHRAGPAANLPPPTKPACTQLMSIDELCNETLAAREETRVETRSAAAARTVPADVRKCGDLISDVAFNVRRKSAREDCDIEGCLRAVWSERRHVSSTARWDKR